MRMSASILSAAAVLSLGGTAAAATVALSGKVQELDGSGKVGVSVVLKVGGVAVDSALTAANGIWTINPSTSVSRTSISRRVSGHLFQEKGRLRFDLAGRDPGGRAVVSAARGSKALASLPSARAADIKDVGVPDTLEYSFAGKVFLRDTLTVLTSVEIVRSYDTTWNATFVYGYLKDSRDSNLYRTIRIGSQTWMAQNLAFEVDSSWNYGDSVELGAIYGRIYQWTAAMDTSANFNTALASFPPSRRGICPEGWHLPSDAEWSTLIQGVDSLTAGKSLKAASLWKTGPGTDAFGFRLLPAGTMAYNQYAYRNTFSNLNTYTQFWSSSEYVATKAWTRYFGDTYDYAARISTLKSSGDAVRCVQDGI